MTKDIGVNYTGNKAVDKTIDNGINYAVKKAPNKKAKLVLTILQKTPLIGAYTARSTAAFKESCKKHP